MAKSIEEITDIICEFRDSRGWDNSEPNHLLNSIFIELGELAEHYQWKNKFPEFSEEEMEIVGFEFVDVIVYLFNLARLSGVDIEKSFDKKMPLLAKKFPVGGDHKKAHDEYRKSGKNKKYE